MAISVFIDLLFIVILLAGFYAAYRAGWNDGRRWEVMQKQYDRYKNTFPMEHTHGGDADDL